jgi:hypothetical protein
MPFLVASCVSMDRVAADCSNDLDQYRGTADRIADRYCGGATVKQFRLVRWNVDPRAIISWRACPEQFTTLHCVVKTVN